MKISFCGISGSGMSSLAQILKLSGHEVQGSDRNFDSYKDLENKKALEDIGIKIYPQDGSGLSSDIDFLCVSTAVEDTIPDVKIAKTILTKNGHIICKLVSSGGKYLDAVAFRAENTPLGEKLLGKKEPTESFYIAGTLKLDTWNGNNKLQIFIRDMACV